MLVGQPLIDGHNHVEPPVGTPEHLSIADAQPSLVMDGADVMPGNLRLQPAWNAFIKQNSQPAAP